MIHCLADKMFNIFSNRELAVLVWIIILLIVFLFKIRIWKNIQNLIGSFFNRKILIPFIILIFYVVIITLILYNIKIWDSSLLKDTLFWFASSAFVIFINIYKADDSNFFKNLLKDNLKLILILEYLSNLYTFSFILEFIFVPSLFILNTSLIFSDYQAKKNTEFARFSKLLSNLLTIGGVFIILFVLYQSIINYEELFSISNLKAFLLPVIYLALCLPFFYIIAIYMQYEIIFSLIGHMLKNKSEKSVLKIKLNILYSANINLSRIKKIRNKIGLITISEDKPEKIISRILRVPLHKRSPVVSLSKLNLFNDIENVRQSLSQNGIGELSEWDFDGVDEFHCMTNYYQFGENLIGLQNNLAYYLIGDELFIKKLELVLNINNKDETELALNKFKDISITTFMSLSLPTSSNLIDAIKNNHEYYEELETYNIKLIKVNSKILTLKLVIESN